MDATRTCALVRKVFCVLFSVALLLPVAQERFRVFPEPAAREASRLSPPSPFESPLEFPERFELYFNRHFGFRNLFILWNIRLRMGYAGWFERAETAEPALLAAAALPPAEPVSPEPQTARPAAARPEPAAPVETERPSAPLPNSPVPQVVVGKQGWLYYYSEQVHEGVTFSEAARGPFHPQSLVDLKKHLEGQRQWLKERGAAFVIVVVPNKSTIYPEFLPPGFRASGPSRLDQIVSYLEKNSDLRLVDLRPAFREARTLYPVYHKQDSHWNDYGAFICFRETARALAAAGVPGIKPPSLDEYEVEVVPKKNSDLADMLLVVDQLGNEEVMLKRRGAAPAKVPLKIVVYHDSFWDRLAPYFVERFDVVIASKRKHIDYESLLSHKPDVVVLQICERYQGVLFGLSENA